MSDYDYCSACPNRSTNNKRHCRPVHSIGPTPAAYLFLGAGPAKTEDRTGTPYSGLAGDELTDTYLPLARMDRRDVAISNCVRCWDGTDRTPSDARVAACARHHLPALLDRVRPEVVVLMGGAACRIADSRIRLDTHHGVPQWTGVLGGQWNGWVWPSYEPALGMRETARMTQLLTDFKRLGEWGRGEWVPPTPDLDTAWLLGKDYRLANTAKQVKEYFDAYPQTNS